MAKDGRCRYSGLIDRKKATGLLDCKQAHVTVKIIVSEEDGNRCSSKDCPHSPDYVKK
jgi:hypothetical protein